MENSIKFKETIGQVGMACREIAFGCEQCSERIEEVELDELELLAGALHEINEVVKKLLESKKTDVAVHPNVRSEADHDGDTDPLGIGPLLRCEECGSVWEVGNEVHTHSCSLFEEP
jgi:uncharacterized Zn finger protein